MSETFRLGEVAGVRVGVNWSVLVIFALIWFSLAVGNLPIALEAVGEQRSTTAFVVAGGVTAVVFLLSLLAHEVSHAVVARRNGLQVEGITLWLFGGVARLTGEADSPGAEFRISAVGPFVSVLLGGAFLGLAALAGAVGLGELVQASLSFLAVINVALAVFNMIPAAPLDGGRVLRAALWRWRGDRLRAQIIASRFGVGFGILLIGYGLFAFASGLGIGGLWPAFLGFFLLNAARAEEQFARIRGAVSDVEVREVMTSHPTTADASQTVAAFLEDVLMRERHSTFPVVDQRRRPAGLVTLQRVKAVAPEDRATTRLSDIACPPEEVVTARPDEPLSALLIRLRGNTDGRALVLEDDAVTGIVSPRDIARALQTADLRGDTARV